MVARSPRQSGPSLSDQARRRLQWPGKQPLQDRNTNEGDQEQTMTTRSRKPGKEAQTAQPTADAKAAARKVRNASDPQGGPKQRHAQKRERKPPGRKPWTPDLEKIEQWAQLGLKDCEIAGLCGVRKETFSARKNELNEQNEQNEQSELASALARGRAKGISMASTALWCNIANGDTQAIKFYLERVAGWKQTQVIEKGKSIEDLTDEELLALLENLSAERESSKSGE